MKKYGEIEMNPLFLVGLLIVWASGLINAENKVLSLDGDGDYVRIPASVWFHGDLTIEAWVY